MLGLIILGTIFALATGFGIKVYLDRTQSEYRITTAEFAIATAVILLIVAPTVSYVGTRVAITNQVTFNENWGGWETEAIWTKQQTHRDGPHRWGYDCDPYQVYVVDRSAYTDDKGRYHPEEGHYETRYHDCPYATEEWTFTIRTTLGEYEIADRNLPTNPNQYRWRSYKHVPEDLPSGVPQFWRDAKDRLDKSDPGPVTARRQYENYILASQSTILQRFSDSIDRYKKDKLLPALSTRPVHDFYFADRVFFVGTHPAGDWQGTLNRFDAALGSSLQGDLYLVIVDAARITDPDNYAGALMAYWQSKEFGKDALSKNGIVVVVGTTDGKTISWARAGTGMPVGNEAMLIDIQNAMPGKQLDAEALFGHPTPSISTTANQVKVTIRHSQGVLEQILWGPHFYQRVSMSSKSGKGVGYEYLKREIQPTSGQQVLILLCTVLFSGIVWGVCVAVGVPAYRSARGRFNSL